MWNLSRLVVDIDHPMNWDRGKEFIPHNFVHKTATFVEKLTFY